jgi:hypothetical protein
MKPSKRALIAPAFALAALLAGAARADEDILSKGRAPGPGGASPPMPGFETVIGPTLVPACSRDGWLIETSFRMQARADLVQAHGGLVRFRAAYGAPFSQSLEKLIRDAVGSRPGAQDVLAKTPAEAAAPAPSSLTGELLTGIEKLASPLENGGGGVRVLVTLDTVRAVPRGCLPG